VEQPSVSRPRTGVHRSSRTSPSFFRAVGRAVRVRDGKVALIGVLAIVLLVMQTSIGHLLLRDSGLSRPSATFVALYFPDSRALPSKLPASGRLELSFVVDNVAATTGSFTWQVSQAKGSSQLSLATGRASVGANRTLTVTRNLHVHCSTRRTQLRVSIQRPPARLTLWLACPNPR
jgi:hypothetical protein